MSETTNAAQLANISVDVQTFGNGHYDTYISTEGSSGAHYPDATAAQIGEYVADLIDTLEEEYNGNSYLHPRYMLITSDGYRIKTDIYNSRDEAYTAMKKEYDDGYQSAFGNSGKPEDNASEFNDTEAQLYTGYDVFLWRMVKID